jgi:hypothetical protein
MATYYVDDGGDNTTGASWATAYTSIASLDTAVSLASGDIVYIGHDHAASQASALTVVGPTSGLPVSLISATQGSNPPTYQRSTTNQIETTGNNILTFDGSFALYGVCVASGSTSFLLMNIDLDETGGAESTTYKLGANAALVTGTSSTGGRVAYRDISVDLSADGTTNRTGAVVGPNASALCEIDGLSFVNAAYRTGFVIGATAFTAKITGADFSGFTNATACEIVGGGYNVVVSNSLTAATWVPVSGTPPGGAVWEFYNVGPADAPTYMYVANVNGTVASSTSIYRTGGATVEGDAASWLITTTATCAESFPLTTPWMYGLVSSTGSKTFDVYITNDTADFDDSQAWLEVEYLGTADEAQWTLAKDQRATITTTAAAQTDDVTSTWNGSGPSFTYKQKLSVTATVGETGQYRARVVVGVASIAGSRYFYIDPKVTVT